MVKLKVMTNCSSNSKHNLKKWKFNKFGTEKLNGGVNQLLMSANLMMMLNVLS
jgi:hypothetical protein